MTGEGGEGGEQRREAGAAAREERERRTQAGRGFPPFSTYSGSQSPGSRLPAHVYVTQRLSKCQGSAALFFSRPTDNNSLGVPKIRRRPARRVHRPLTVHRRHLCVAAPSHRGRRRRRRRLRLHRRRFPSSFSLSSPPRRGPSDKKIMDRRDPVSRGRRTSTGLPGSF